MMSEGHECKKIGWYKGFSMYIDCETHNTFILSRTQIPGIDPRLYESDTLVGLWKIIDAMEPHVTPH
jgi:hypothetical protein